MKYILKSFSQDVHLSRPDESHHYLVFEREDGTEFRIPVAQDAIISLTQQTLAYEAKKKKPEEFSDEHIQNVVEEAEEELQQESEDEEAPTFGEEDSDDFSDATVFGDGGGDEEEGEGDSLGSMEPIRPIEPRMRKVPRNGPQNENEVPSL